MPCPTVVRRTDRRVRAGANFDQPGERREVPRWRTRWRIRIGSQLDGQRTQTRAMRVPVTDCRARPPEQSHGDLVYLASVVALWKLQIELVVEATCAFLMYTGRRAMQVSPRGSPTSPCRAARSRCEGPGTALLRRVLA